MKGKLEMGGYSGEVFCNRNLNMQKVEAVGFDMDYTLATYKSDTFEVLAYEGARKRLVEDFGYPTELLTHSTYDPNYFCRGLIVDKKRGNIIKMDRHKWVKIVYHGFDALSKTERDSLYDPTITTWSTFREPDYAILDTLFSLPDAYLFCELVQLKDKQGSTIKNKSYIDMYKDVRRCVDISHRDGYIKEKVGEDPSKYIHYDPDMVPMLKRIKNSGRKVFLVTNSLYDYTNVVMHYLTTGKKLGDDGVNVDWHELFDVIIVGACKPSFLEDSRNALYRVDTRTEMLMNTEGPLFESSEDYLSYGKVFQGGNYIHLHRLLNVSSGSQLVYVGDHMYSDILRSKRELGWRTMLVIPELEHEIDVMVEQRELEKEIAVLRGVRDELDEWKDRIENEYLNLELSKDEETQDKDEVALRLDALKLEMERIQTERDMSTEELKLKTKQYHEAFHPIWGQLFKTGYQNSRFAAQVDSYACLYTSKVTNLMQISPDHNFRCMPDIMPHDRLEDTPIRKLLRARLTNPVKAAATSSSSSSNNIA
eukprot:CAMPEP_0182444378 /NCGR_PEP_ID=MMETSP1172-20130603/2844_1 /TAXON_ID=708627 /ORGANISM="Timspurckia oligopyrenoides, Strain CCMP3278" /LENGTH=535 /DNA_ID=CAMNT_0024639917 /DNA_START=349 /DNA_END=1956 /DNA_ORIENTATION=+